MTLLLLMIATASATTYTEDLKIPATEPVSIPIEVQTRVDFDTNLTEDDQEIDSDWSYVTCGIKDGDIWAQFTGPVGNWPTTIPSTATCTSGSDSLVLNIIETEDFDADWDEDTTPGTGYEIDVPEGVSGEVSYKLPTTQTYVTCEDGSESKIWKNCTDDDSDGKNETFTKYAKLTPQSNWTDVLCDVGETEDNEVLIRIIYNEDADGSGYCRVKYENGNFGIADVTITRI